MSSPTTGRILVMSAPAGASPYVKLATSTLGSAAASINISSLAAYSHYRITIEVKALAGTPDTLGFRFNGDAGANYSSSGGSGSTSLQIGGAISFANIYSFAVFDVWNPLSAGDFAMITGYNTTDRVASTPGATPVYGAWNSHAQINQVTLFTQSGNNMNTGSTLTVWGWNDSNLIFNLVVLIAGVSMFAQAIYSLGLQPTCS